ncbi:MAG TPA: carboxypeptidase-like regulatory domain-containing protein [Bryobacteraceae bacterium]|nr:carboxypeptidase-like regulatory domain-containing protein [Bryobacteraceae bacterium]
MSPVSQWKLMISRGFIAIIYALGLASSAHAQAVAVAEVSGMVSDQSGSAIPGAEVLATETDKHTVHRTVTDSLGQYVLPNLPVGPYTLEVKANGFKDYVETGLDLQVGNNIRMNVSLQVGSISERVEVQANASLVETKENSISNVVDQQRINDLPLNSRQATQLILTLGAASYGDSGDTGSKTFYSSTRISVAGGQGNGTAYLLDGGDHTDAMSNVNMPFPFPDALQEFSVDTSAVSSRFGTHPGATVNAVTMSGSNQFHGDLFEFIRNGDLDARNFFAKTHDTLKRNQFGGTAGGRLIKDKLFYFGGYQGTRNRSNPPQSIAHIPTEAALTGDFSTLAGAGCQSSGKAQQLVNPSNGAPFSANQIPQSLLNPVAVAIAQKYLPIGSADPCGKVTFGIPVTGDEDQYIGRVDWIENAKHTLYGRYFLVNFQNPPTFNGSNALTTTAPGNFERAQSATIGDTYTFGPGTLNSFHVSFNRIRDNRGPTSIPINPTALGVDMYSAVPNFLLLTVTNYFSTFCGTCAPGHFNNNSFQTADDVDVIRGRHQMAFGFNLIRVQNNTISGFDENGTFTWNGSFTGNGLADFMVGRMSDFQQTNPTPDDLRQWVMSFYAQDSFRVSSRITLNYGLRWEPTFADPDKYGRGDSINLAAFYAGQVSTVHPTAPAGLFFKGDPGIPAAMWNGHMANFAPRVGVVWSPHADGRDTLRAGGAILYDSTETWFNERETTNPPFGNDIDVGSTGTLTNPWVGYPGGNPFPQHGNLFFPKFGTYINMPINPKPTYVAQWNVTYQRQFAGNWLASASYLGNKTTHLWISQEVDPAEYLGTAACTIAGVSYSTCSTTKNTNQRRVLFQSNPTLGTYYASIDTMDDGAVAHYEAMLLSLQHRFGHNYVFVANYTDSYCLSDYDFGAALATPTSSQPFNRHADWGPCVFDTRHNFNTSLVATSSWPGSNTWARRLLSNWVFAPLIHASSGQPLNVTTGKDQSLTGLNNDRPNQVLSNVYPANAGCTSAPCDQWLNPTAFVPNPIGTFGNVGRNEVRGPSTVNVDAALSRVFRFNERYKLEARAEAFNVINHTNFVGAISPAGLVQAFTVMNTGLNSSSFGQAQSAFDPRILQFALKVYF